MKFFSTLLIISLASVFLLPQAVSAKVTNPTFDVDGFWWLDDDASGTDVEDNTGFGAGNTAENTHITGLNKNSNVRLRINLEETANQTTGTNVQPRLEYQSGNVLCNAGGTWTTITTSSANAFQLVNSTTITDGNKTDVDRVTDPAAKAHIANGELLDATNPATSVLVDNESAEWEWNFIATTNAADSQIYTFRIVDALGTALVYNLPTVNDCPNATTAAPVSAPTVTTNAETGVTVSSATLNGEITATGGENATSRGFAWGTVSTLSGGDTSTTTESGSFGTGTYSQALFNLLAGKTYYFRAYATNSAGTGYGSVIESFVTGTDTSIARKIRLFGGYLIKLINSRVKLY